MSHTPPPQGLSFGLSCTFTSYSWNFVAYSVSYWKFCAYIQNRGQTSYSVILMYWISDHKVLDKVCVSFCPQKVLSDRKDLLSRSCTKLRTAKKPPAVHVQSRSSFIHRKDDRKVYVLIKYLRLCFTYKYFTYYTLLGALLCTFWCDEKRMMTLKGFLNSCIVKFMSRFDFQHNGLLLPSCILPFKKV